MQSDRDTHSINEIPYKSSSLFVCTTEYNALAEMTLADIYHQKSYIIPLSCTSCLLDYWLKATWKRYGLIFCHAMNNSNTVILNVRSICHICHMDGLYIIKTIEIFVYVLYFHSVNTSTTSNPILWIFFSLRNN